MVTIAPQQLWWNAVWSVRHVNVWAVLSAFLWRISAGA